MKPLFLNVVLYEPSSGVQFPVTGDGMDDIVVDIVPMLFGNVVGLHDPMMLQVMNRATGMYALHANDFKPTDEFFLRVQFARRTFSVPRRRFVGPGDSSAATAPHLLPTRLPAWDTGWDNNYDDNEFFDNGDLKIDCSEAAPVVLKVPLREFYNVGHRGAPYFFPENTIASFQKAVHLGASGFEFDVCLTKDDHVLVYHDSKQDAIALQRRWMEGLPYPVVSPDFDLIDGKMNVSIKTLRNGVYEQSPWRPLASPYEFDFINLTAAEVRAAFRYHHMEGIEHRIPELDEFLEFVSTVSDQIKFLFFDIKNPGDSNGDERSHMKRYGELIGASIKKFHPLPKTMVICNVITEYIDDLREGVAASGEDRPLFAYDAAAALFKEDPLEVANSKRTSVISVGATLRPGDVNDIIAGVRCRDYPQEYPAITTKIKTVVHWTLNDPRQILESFMTGVNGILTDRPDELKTTLEQKMKVVIP
jgi:glycerophosphoryl diester phosphodiesterase